MRPTKKHHRKRHRNNNRHRKKPIPLPAPKTQPPLNSVMDQYESYCYEKYSNKEWFNKVLKKGWPGVKGEVRLGRPVVNRFGEVIVVILCENGYTHAEVLGMIKR